MDHITFTRNLTALGHRPDEIAAMARSGRLHRIRRGAYLSDAPEGEVDLRTAHSRLIRATIAQCSADLVVSHLSAAVVHGLPIWAWGLDRVHVIQNRRGNGKTRSLVKVRGLPIEPDEISVVDGIVVTSLARTVLDLACALPMEYAVAVGDAALRFGVRPVDLDVLLERAGRRHGIAAARRAIAFLDERAESPGESRSRVLFHLNGIPAPEPQFLVHDADGRFVARTDFGWRDLRTVGEYDGRVKYQRSLRPGHDPERELFREKQREDRVRDLDLQVVRWVTADLERPAALLDRLQRAFDRGRRHRG